MKKILSILLVCVLLFSMTACGAKESSNEKKTIRIANKNYTEQRITGQLLAVYLESKGYDTDVRILAGTMLCYNALKNDEIDIYPEFTGSAYTAVFKQEEILSKEETYNYVKERGEKEHGITWLTPLGWNNTYVITVREETANKYNLKSITDLAKVSKDFKIGGTVEFFNRVDGLKGLKKLYTGLEFKEEISMDPGLTYAALRDGEIDVNSAFSTDGRIAKYNLKNLEDDKDFFPPYFITPITRVKYAEENPEVIKALHELGNQWTVEELQNYNLRVDEGEDAKDVATEMLKDKGLIK